MVSKLVAMTTALNGSSAGRVAIVTGASRGVGQAAIRCLAARGYAVVVNYLHDQRAAESIVDAILADNGNAVAVRADVADDLDVKRLFAETIAAFGGIDVVVHAAGGRITASDITKVGLDEFDALVRINTRATFVVNREAARHLRDGGAIVNLSSSADGSSLRTHGLYAVTKAPADVLTRAFALELRERNISVNAMSLEVDIPYAPNQVADVIAYLLSEHGHGLTGQVLRVGDPGLPFAGFHGLRARRTSARPRWHGRTAADAFDVVILSLPGYGFSGKPAAAGWGPERIARAWAVLMERLGYTRYVAQGGDWGTAVTAAMARQAPAGLLGIHVNFAQMVPLEILGHIRNGEPAPAGTPVGLAAWLLDHDTGTGTYEHLARLFAGQPYGAITRQDWLDNTSLYWLTNTATSAARLYWQQAVTGQNFYAPADVSLPAAVTVFPEEYVHAPRSWTEQAYHNLIYFNEAERGGHFAAWEQPQLFAEELRAAFRTLR